MIIKNIKELYYEKRFLSLIIALAMMVGVFTPLIANAADETEVKPTPLTEAEDVTREVIVHKILMSKDALKSHDVNKVNYKDGEIDKKYDGQKIDNIGDFFGDKEAKEIAGVYFVVEKQFDVKKQILIIIIKKILIKVKKP